MYPENTLNILEDFRDLNITLLSIISYEFSINGGKSHFIASRKATVTGKMSSLGKQ